MGLRSGGRKLSFEILSGVDSFTTDGDVDAEDGNRTFGRSNSHPVPQNGVVLADGKSNRRKLKRRNSKKKKSNSSPNSTSSSMNPIAEEEDKLFLENLDLPVDNHRPYQKAELEGRCHNFVAAQSISSVVCEEVSVPAETAVTVSQVSSLGELRQRSVNGGGSSEELLSSVSVMALRGGDSEKEEVNSLGKQRNEPPNGKLETVESLDWKRLMIEDPNYPLLVEKSPVKYFMEEMYCGNSLRSTTTLGNEKEREKVYDTIFRLPWRCELLINVGFFVCLNSFLSLLTIMPVRALMMLWRLITTRQFKKPSSAELSDFGCLIVLACGVVLLEQTDISLIYHMIRGQGTIKLYVVYNVLEIFDKLWQSFGGDVFETLFNSADGLVNCSHESLRYWVRRYIIDLMLAAASSIIHSFILLAQAITLSTCIVAHNNALLALLVSNNFAEIKSNVFKRFNKDNVHSIVYSDSVERFHISAFLLFVLAQNILEAEGPWFGNFLSNALLVYICEMAIDIIKHSFLAKFNNIKPIAYSEFLEDLCKQTLNIQIDGGRKNLTFVPLAPACVVIRVLTPIYAAYLPCGPFPWRLFWIFVLAVLTCIMLTSLKVMIGMALQKHAAWYVKRCQKRKLHSD
ncbi:hypothetical protein Ancab_018367 [Ancistrocladus abbreviatus]